MTIRVTHELHDRRFSRNMGLGLVLVGLVALVFGLTVVKVTNLGPVQDYAPAVQQSAGGAQ
ncbi:hypothetical protein [Tranquillimonas alkanivorans]|uniref:Cytochrome C oxidase assembly protein n=1 Tax=Tranquillimonas alkanivorans TaxID=441119 RepID=A0A1I5M600_9RHOB|nr:hypothetical protein [Tranquillimonas alkanivorans]SFP04923.1 hypothetical protein SAMN04488047_102113 [Tranquillimonas alkanivorans]